MRCATICRDTERVPLGASLFARGGVSQVSVRACEASVRSREAPRAASVASSRGKSREQGFARGREGERLKRHARRGGARHIGAAQRPEQRGRALESVRSHRRTPSPRGFAARRLRARICLVMRSAAPLSLNVSLLVGRQKIFVTCDIVVRLDDPHRCQNRTEREVGEKPFLIWAS